LCPKGRRTAMGSMVGVDEEYMELVVEIIDFRRQYDIL
jgi:hypothetical protein